MKKYKYIKDFDINLSARQLYPLLSTPEGLAKWFAKSVEKVTEKKFLVCWDEKIHTTRISAKRNLHYVNYTFGEKNAEDPNYLNFTIRKSELTGETYLEIVDYSEMNNVEELDSLWQNFIDNLQEHAATLNNE